MIRRASDPRRLSRRPPPARLAAALLLGAIPGAAPAATHYVWTGSPLPASPYTNWATAAHTVQAAVDAATGAGAVVLVTNGTYLLGAEIAVTAGTVVESVEGAGETVLDGQGAVRCVRLAHADAVLRGFTVTGGSSASGGGVLVEGGGLVDRCIVRDNAAVSGGGIYLSGGGTVRNCLVRGNAANGVFGGGGGIGLDAGQVLHCTVASNVCENGGGVWFNGGGQVVASIVYSNVASFGSANYTNTGASADFTYSCTTPGPSAGEGNLAAPPAFLGPQTGDYRLRYGSPCIDAGTNVTPAVAVDLDGRARPVDGLLAGTPRVDLGAYEYDPGATDSDGDLMDDRYEHVYGLAPLDAGDAQAHADTDGIDNLGEYFSDTDPTDADSFLRVTSFERAPGIVLVSFPSSSNRVYTLDRSAELVSGGWSNVTGSVRVPGTGAVQAFGDTNAVPAAFYRVSAELP